MAHLSAKAGGQILWWLEVPFPGTVGGRDSFKSEVNMCEVGTGVMLEISDSPLILGVWGIHSATLGLQPFWFLETGRRVRDHQSLL